MILTLIHNTQLLAPADTFHTWTPDLEVMLASPSLREERTTKLDQPAAAAPPGPA
jgi:hypothetical protein